MESITPNHRRLHLLSTRADLWVDQFQTVGRPIREPFTDSINRSAGEMELSFGGSLPAAPQCVDVMFAQAILEPVLPSILLYLEAKWLRRVHLRSSSYYGDLRSFSFWRFRFLSVLARAWGRPGTFPPFHRRREACWPTPTSTKTSSSSRPSTSTPRFTTGRARFVRGERGSGCCVACEVFCGGVGPTLGRRLRHLRVLCLTRIG